jgi:PadR family transcriptional regulator PadR
LRRRGDLLYDAVQMKQPEALGEFEQVVLLAIVRLGSDAYGATIRAEIEGRLDRVVAVGALYTALDRLERKGYVRSWLSDPTPQRGGRAKRYFELRPVGAAALRRSRETLERMWTGIRSDVLESGR